MFCICSANNGTCSPSGDLTCTPRGFNYRCTARRTHGAAINEFEGSWHGWCEQDVALSTMGSAASLRCSTGSCAQEYNITYRNTTGALETMYHSGRFAPGSSCISAPATCSEDCHNLMATLTHRNVSTASSIAGGCLSNYFTVKLAAQKSVQISCADSDASTAKEMTSDMQWFNNFGGMQVAFVYALLLHMRVVLLNAS